MRHPLATPAALLLNESLVITRPATRLRPGWMGLSVSFHLLAGAALIIAPLFLGEKLDPPELRPYITIPVNTGGYTPPPPKGDPRGSETKIPDRKPEPVKKIEVPNPVLNALKPLEVILAGQNPEETGTSGMPKGDPDGKIGGTGNIGDIESGDPNLPIGPGRPGIPGGVETFRSYDLVDQPVLISHVEPAYPEQARAQGISGTVILEVIVDENGRVASARVTRSDNALFDAPALASVKRWKYTAARADGRAVRTYKTVTIRFTLH